MKGVSKIPLKLLSNHTNPIHLAAIGLLRQYNKGGAWLPQDFKRLGLNVFNQIISPQLMRLLCPKDILTLAVSLVVARFHPSYVTT